MGLKRLIDRYIINGDIEKKNIIIIVKDILSIL